MSAHFASDPRSAERWLDKHYPEADEPRAVAPEPAAAASAPPLIVRLTPQPPRPDLPVAPPVDPAKVDPAEEEK